MIDQQPRPHSSVGPSNGSGATRSRADSGAHSESPRVAAPGSNQSVPLSQGMQRAQDEYRKTIHKHPDALGGALAELVVEEVALVSRMQQVIQAHLSRPGLELRDIEEVRRVIELKNVSLKQIKGLSNLEYELRKRAMVGSEAMGRLEYNSKSEWTARELKIPPQELEDPLPPANQPTDPQRRAEGPAGPAGGSEASAPTGRPNAARVTLPR